MFHSTAKKVNEPVVLKFGRKNMSGVKYVKFLGVLLDETLSWKYHLIELSRKLSRTVGVMYKLRHFAPLDTLKSILCTVLSLPDIWYNCVGSPALMKNFYTQFLSVRKKPLEL